MPDNHSEHNPLHYLLRGCSGFTLVELMVGMVVTAIVTIAIFATYNTNRQTVMTQRQVADMQQQLRGAMYIMQRDIRMAGFDPTGAGTAAAPAGIADIRRYQINADPPVAPTANLGGSPALTLAFDSDSDGVLEQSTYLLYDIDNDGVVDLANTADAGGTYNLVAQGIQAVGFAYAYDEDGDGELDNIGGDIIWAVDTDNDNQLDTNLDTNGDGVIDQGDDTDGNNVIDGVALATPVPLDRIRVVRIWLLCRSTRPAQKVVSEANAANQFYVVGAQLIPHANDGFRRRLLEMSANCRNLGL